MNKPPLLSGRLARKGVEGCKGMQACLRSLYSKTHTSLRKALEIGAAFPTREWDAAKRSEETRWESARNTCLHIEWLRLAVAPRQRFANHLKSAGRSIVYFYDQALANYGPGAVCGH